MSFEEELQQFREMLFSSPLVKEYFRYKNLLANDEQIQSLVQEIHQHEKNMTMHMMEDEVYQKEKQLYLEKKQIYEQHPLVINYSALQEEVQVLLKEIRDILQ